MIDANQTPTYSLVDTNPYTGRPIVELPHNGVDDQLIQNTTDLVRCANFHTPNTTKGINQARVCKAAVDNAVRTGLITDFPAMFLALRQIPFTNASGNDKVAQMSDELITTIDANRSEQIVPYNNGDYNVNRKPITINEGATIIGGGRKVVTPDMAPNREFTIDPYVAYMATAADVVIHTGRYVPAGKTAREAVADTRTRNPKAKDDETQLKCAMRTADVSFGMCELAAARNTLEMVANGQYVPYNPARYGIRSNNR
jgi:hypothetical protein